MGNLIFFTPTQLPLIRPKGSLQVFKGDGLREGSKMLFVLGLLFRVPAVKGLCLAQAFKQGDPCGGGKIQRPGGRGDRYMIGGIGISAEDIFRQAFGFGAEYQKQPLR